MITLNVQSIITAGAVVGALTALITLFVKIVRWIDHQKEQDKDIEDIRQQMESRNQRGTNPFNLRYPGLSERATAEGLQRASYRGDKQDRETLKPKGS